MTRGSSTTSNGGITFAGLLAIVFITLKLTGVIDWSWWWVLAPLWMPAAAFVLVMVCLLAAAAIVKARR